MCVCVYRLRQIKHDMALHFNNGSLSESKPVMNITSTKLRCLTSAQCRPLDTCRGGPPQQQGREHQFNENACAAEG